MKPQSRDVAAVWDREYRAGRYAGEPPVLFVQDILDVAEREGLSGAAGLYIGCGNGRNFPPLLDAGMDLTGVDLSSAAIETLRGQLQGRKARLIHGELSDVPAGLYGVVVGIQVFQHGSRAICHEHIRAAQDRVAPGGILAVRVNAIGTDIEFAHEVVEPGDERNGVTIRYLEGPKAGLLIHFFGRPELEDLFAAEFTSALPLRLDFAQREAPATGQWSQWEGIWKRRPFPGP